MLHRLWRVGFLLSIAFGACISTSDKIDIDGQDIEVVFIHSADIHSRLIPYLLDVGVNDQGLGLNSTNAPFGGIARLSAVVRQERRDNERFAYIDTGDVVQGAPIFNAFSGEPEFRAMTNMGVDVFTIGNHEFDNGPTILVDKAVKYANFPMLAANYLVDDPDRTGNSELGYLAQPYTILNLKGLKVGVIGLGDIGTMRSIFKGGNSLGITPLRTREILQQYVDYLRPQVDLVVVASHVGYHDDLEFIPRTEGIDVVFGGHLHIALNPPNVVQDCDIAKLKRERDRYICNTPDKLRQSSNECKTTKQCDNKSTEDEKLACEADCEKEAQDNCLQEEKSARYAEKLKMLDEDIRSLEQRGCHPRNVLLVHSGAFLKYFGRLQVTLRQCTRLDDQKEVCIEYDSAGQCVNKVARRCVGRSDGRNDWEIASFNYKLTPVDKNLPDDPKMLQLLEPYVLSYSREQMISQVIGYSSTRLKRYSSGSGDSQVGNMVADAMQIRNQVWADFAVTNSLGIRSDIVAGPLDEEQLTNVFPFENNLTVMYLSGYEVQELMDFITQRSTSRGCQSQAQVAGLTADLNCGGCATDGGNKCIRQAYNGEACAQRVTIGGSGRPCEKDEECEKDDSGNLMGEICTGQRHPIETNKRTCGMPISCYRSYRLVANDYIARGGSGFQVLERNTTQENLGISLRASAKDYILAMPSCSQNPDPRHRTTPEELLTELDKQLLHDMEAKATDGDLSNLAAVDTDFNNLRNDIKNRADSEVDFWKKAGYTNYLSCTDDQTIGFAARAVKACSTYESTQWCRGLPSDQEVNQCLQEKTQSIAKCETLARVRSGLRCLTLPCITAQEDGRLQRKLKTTSGSLAPDEPWLE